MAKAVYNGTVIAESDETKVVEGNHYFPPESVKSDLLLDSDTHTTCPWKGVASYKHLRIDGETLEDAVWHYPQPSEKALEIKDHFAFGGPVEVTD